MAAWDYAKRLALAQTPVEKRSLVHIALLVDDYDDAIFFYTKILGFNLVEDTYIAEQDKRWVLVSPNAGGTTLLLARASDEHQHRFVGNQSGGRVFLFLGTDDFWRDYHRLVAHKVKIVRKPTEHDYGVVAVFEDLYGNLWDLIQYVKD
ncbi:MAG: catechol 2,3-dioxygenase-like lactoylglutathione lyase family enzyme [Parasphingorhabdus sp.]|jgi:catechol 2,3-dioxygenase-like lactoylglutathione lyase family enzyme